ncbi:hypothetical protein D3C85_1125660 [compost metagenome]
MVPATPSKETPVTGVGVPSAPRRSATSFAPMPLPPNTLPVAVAPGRAVPIEVASLRAVGTSSITSTRSVPCVVSPSRSVTCSAMSSVTCPPAWLCAAPST